jgi:hypothetical protein
LTFAAESGVHPGRTRPPRAVLPGSRAGRDGCLMIALSVRGERETGGAAAGHPRVRGRGARHPCGDVAVLLASELFVISVRQRLGFRRRTVAIAVKTGDGLVRLKVTDRGRPGMLRPRPVASDAESGRGLELVAAPAAGRGWRRRGVRTVTWFVLRHAWSPGRSRP